MSSSSGRAGHDRWVVSYADLVTLMLAFFITIYAASEADATRFHGIAESLQEADVPPVLASTPASIIVEPPTALREPAEPEVREAADLETRLARELRDAVDERWIEVVRDARGLVVSLPERATFPTASADVTIEARRLIARVGQTLLGEPNDLRIEGHTDDVPIRTPRYASNWELSAARAASVVALMVDSVGIEADRLSAAGYGEFHPRVSNDSAVNRGKNRRVDIVVLDTPRARARNSVQPGD